MHFSRCKLPDWTNDSYSPFSELHNQSIHQWIPVDKDGGLDSCKIYTSSMNNKTEDCREYVFDKSVYWGVTLNERVSITIKTLYREYQFIFSVSAKCTFTYKNEYLTIVIINHI